MRQTKLIEVDGSYELCAKPPILDFEFTAICNREMGIVLEAINISIVMSGKETETEISNRVHCLQSLKE